MEELQNMEQKSNSQILAAHLALIGTDVEAWSDLLAEDVEFPYAAALGSTSRLKGKSALYNHIKKAVARMRNWSFTDVREYQTMIPNVLYAEFHGEAVSVSTGQPYKQDYVMRLETKNGKIVYYREYWNSVAALAVTSGGTPATPLDANS